MAYKIDKKRILILIILLCVAVLIIRGCVISGAEGIAFVPEGKTISVFNEKTGRVIKMPLETYIKNVVAAEMPAAYDIEALKAQAVAARTFAVRRMKTYGGSSCKSNAEICTSSGCCQAYADEAAQRERWGGEYETYSEKISRAVSETVGKVLFYDDEPIDALYHAVSGGETEDSAHVFSARPYLIGVESPGEEDASHYTDSLTFSREEFVRKISAAIKGASLNKNKLEKEVLVTSRYESGRVKTVKLNNAECTGKEIRDALVLYSSNFSFEFSKKNVIITTIGYGHGVGMSQSGANAMAKSGNTYEEILNHYYVGVEIKQIDE
ncbi:MAG: stage II sporulation protein D [Clostridia bacterium]